MIGSNWHEAYAVDLSNLRFMKSNFCIMFDFGMGYQIVIYACLSDIT